MLRRLLIGLFFLLAFEGAYAAEAPNSSPQFGDSLPELQFHRGQQMAVGGMVTFGAGLGMVAGGIHLLQTANGSGNQLLGGIALGLAGGLTTVGGAFLLNSGVSRAASILEPQRENPWCIASRIMTGLGAGLVLTTPFFPAGFWIGGALLLAGPIPAVVQFCRNNAEFRKRGHSVGVAPVAMRDGAGLSFSLVF